MTRTATTPFLFLMLTSMVPLTACSGDDSGAVDPRLELLRSVQPDPELAAFLKDNFGIQMRGLEQSADFVYESDGTLVASSDGVIEVDGLGSTEIFVHEIIYPQAEGGDVELYIEDRQTGDNRYFYYDPVDNFVVFVKELEEGLGGLEDPERGATVSRNEDGTYSVWTFDDAVAPDEEVVQTVLDGYAALALVNEFAEFNEIPPFIALSAIAIGYTDVPEGRFPLVCTTDTALRPPVCTSFKEFCDCAACQVSGREGCELCPPR